MTISEYWTLLEKLKRTLRIPNYGTVPTPSFLIVSFIIEESFQEKHGDRPAHHWKMFCPMPVTIHFIIVDTPIWMTKTSSNHLREAGKGPKQSQRAKTKVKLGQLCRTTHPLAVRPWHKSQTLWLHVTVPYDTIFVLYGTVSHSSPFSHVTSSSHCWNLVPATSRDAVQGKKSASRSGKGLEG